MNVVEDKDLGKISSMESKITILDFRLTATEVILTEIKDALKELVQLNQNTLILQKDHRYIIQEVEKLRKDFDEGQKNIYPILKESDNLVSRVKGAVMVAVILASLASWVAVGKINELSLVVEQGQRHDTDIQLLKSESLFYHSSPPPTIHAPVAIRRR